MGNGEMNIKAVSGFLQQAMETAKRVITQPVDFFRSMPTEGGLKEPLLFAVVMGLAGGIIAIVMGILGFGMYAAGLYLLVVGLIFTPIMVIIGLFILSGVLFLIWKFMGSQKNYETAFRCAAFMTAITPVTTILGFIPYLGVLSILWMLYLVVAASVEVHSIDSQKAWIVFGIIAAVFVLLNITAQRQAARMEKGLEQFGTSMEEMSQKSPEELGEALGKFMKGVKQGSGE